MLEALKKNGFTIASESDMPRFEQYVSVRVRAHAREVMPELNGIALSRPTMAQSEIQVRGFEFITQEHGQVMLEFEILSPGHRSFWGTGLVFDPHTFRKTSMTFADFCFKRARETTPESAQETRVPAPAGEMGDLTWRLPCKFVDDIVETLYVLNNDVLDGAMLDAWLCGPGIFDGDRGL